MAISKIRAGIFGPPYQPVVKVAQSLLASLSRLLRCRNSLVFQSMLLRFDASNPAQIRGASACGTLTACGKSRTAASGILTPGSSLSRLARISINTASSRRLDPGAMLRRISLWDFYHTLLTTGCYRKTIIL
jgi:hypothetical protein